MGFTISHKEAELALLRIQEIPPEREDAVRSRLRGLQRLGLAAEARRGQGKRAQYRATDLVMMALALDLSQLGLTPERTISVLETKRSDLLAATVDASAGLRSLGATDSVTYLAFDPVALRGGDIFFKFLEANDLRGWLVEQSGFTRIALINLSAIIKKLTDWLLQIALSAPSIPELAARPRLFLSELAEERVPHEES